MPSAAGPAVSVRSRTTLMPCLTTTAAAGSSIASASRLGIAACRAALRSRFARARMPVSYSTPSLMALMRGVAGRRQSYARRRRGRRCQVLVCAFLAIGGALARSCLPIRRGSAWCSARRPGSGAGRTVGADRLGLCDLVKGGTRRGDRKNSSGSACRMRPAAASPGRGGHRLVARGPGRGGHLRASSLGRRAAGPQEPVVEGDSCHAPGHRRREVCPPVDELAG
jgi:hypothetical protein